MDVTTGMSVITGYWSPYKEYSQCRALKEERMGFYAIRITKDESKEIIIEEVMMNNFVIDVPEGYTCKVERLEIKRDDVKKEVTIRPIPFVYVLFCKTMDKWYTVKRWIKEKLGMS